MEKQVPRAPASRKFIGTLNNPAEKYTDFMAQDWLQAIYTNTKADYVNG